MRHGTFKCIDKKNNAVYHFKNTFYLTTEIGMSWCVNDVDLNAFVMNSGIFG